MNDTLRVVETTEEGRSGQIAARSNWLRAGVMGANDGIVSTAGMVVGVAGAAVGSGALLASGVAALVAGALSMAVGEYVSVSSQRDSEASELAAKQAELDREPIEELEELTRLVQTQGLEVGLARRVAEQLTEKDALAAHARLELGLHPDELASPWHAAWASMAAFVVGGIVPLLAILLTPQAVAVPITALAVVAALVLTGSVSAHLGGSSKRRAVLRTVAGGMAAMAVTYSIGLAVGTQI